MSIEENEDIPVDITEEEVWNRVKAGRAWTKLCNEARKTYKVFKNIIEEMVSGK